MSMANEQFSSSENLLFALRRVRMAAMDPILTILVLFLLALSSLAMDKNGDFDYHSYFNDDGSGAYLYEAYKPSRSHACKSTKSISSSSSTQSHAVSRSFSKHESGGSRTNFCTDVAKAKGKQHYITKPTSSQPNHHEQQPSKPIPYSSEMMAHYLSLAPKLFPYSTKLNSEDMKVSLCDTSLTLNAETLLRHGNHANLLILTRRSIRIS